MGIKDTIYQSLLLLMLSNFNEVYWKYNATPIFCIKLSLKTLGISNEINKQLVDS